MNEDAQKIFDKLVKMNPQDLIPEQVAFLHARRPYLNDEQLRIFKSVLDRRDAEINAIYNPPKEVTVAPPLYVSKKDLKNGNNK